jgi:hypothetical protein
MLRQLGKALAFLSSSLTVVVEKSCVDCAKAKSSDGKEMAVVEARAKVGDKIDCDDKGSYLCSTTRPPASGRRTGVR